MVVVENLTKPRHGDSSEYKSQSDELREIAQSGEKRKHFIATIIGAAGDHDPISLRKLLLPLHPADCASILGDLPEESVRTIIKYIGEELDSEVFAELDEDTRELVVDILPTAALARAIEDLDSDDAVAFVEELDEEERAEVLAQTSPEFRTNIEGALSFEEETAGRLMQREFVAAPEFWDVGRTIDHMRAVGEDLPDLFFEIYVVDPMFKPIGAVAVSRLMRAPRNKSLKDLMENLHVVVKPETDQEDVALSFQKYHLISAPVVDVAGRLNGMITVDDIVQVLQEENEEDMLALAGVSDASTTDDVFESVKSRLPWLMINLFIALVNSTVISNFSGLIEQVVALAVLMPVGSALGGNAGTQTLAVAVRALAQKELTNENSMRIVWREFFTGTFNGLAIGLVFATVAGLWFHSPMIALAAGGVIVIDFIVAGLVGILIPLSLKKLGYDPAVASSIFVTFITDLVGFSAFLTIAFFLLK